MSSQLLNSIAAVPFLLAGKPTRCDEVAAVRNPFNGETVAEVCQAGLQEAMLACDAAAMSFAETRLLPSWRRSQILTGIANGLAEELENFAQGIAIEAGKPIRDSRLEVERAVQTFRVAAEEAKRIGGSILPLDWTPGSDGRAGLVRRVPLGPVLGITPFNFPLNLVAHKVAPALACGAPIVIKPAPAAPLTALRLGELVVKSGWSAGAISVLPCSNEVAAALVASDRLKKLSFTGSADVGWKLKAAAGKKPVTLELGGNAAVVIHSDANVDAAVVKVAKGAFTYSGQSCISVQRVFTHRSIFRIVSEKLTEATGSMKCGDPLDEQTDLGPMISTEAAQRAEGWIKDAIAQGATLLIGGQRSGAMLSPAVLTNVPQQSPLHQEEAFAPLIVLEAYDDFSEAMHRVNRSRYGLQAGVFTNQWPLIAEAYQTIEAGAVLINEVPTWRADHMPYGGSKDSGMGREGLASAIDAMTEPKLLVISF